MYRNPSIFVRCLLQVNFDSLERRCILNFPCYHGKQTLKMILSDLGDMISFSVQLLQESNVT